MKKLMSLSARKELIGSLALRYQAANRSDKNRMLDGFIAATGYHRKYAIAVLNHSRPPPSGSKRGPRRRQRIYTAEVKQALVRVRKAAGRICSKRLVPFLPELVSVLEQQGHLRLSDEVRHTLLRISLATADRLLQDVRRGKQSGLSTTRPGGLLKHQIPIRTFSDWDDLRAGFMEADLVAHCGTSAQGTYLRSLVLTDVPTTT